MTFLSKKTTILAFSVVFGGLAFQANAAECDKDVAAALTTEYKGEALTPVLEEQIKIKVGASTSVSAMFPRDSRTDRVVIDTEARKKDGKINSIVCQ
ncbi:hypothetical protein [Pseudomonas lurida]|jgi:hypothetical protein|uniref:hypothetical protein n=1 Tax=Pseudomonas lurida TaxID=244566 RepID=UPI00125372BE|nr:hypothetical protein PS663_03744 [Pseudomonas fluorescens]